MNKTFHRASGFTLIEALVTLSIVAILGSIAIPSFTKMVEDNRVSAGANDFLSALMLTRSEAAKRSAPVSICTSNDNTTCSATGDYATGWIIFTDCNSDGVISGATACDLDGNGTNDPDLIIRVHESIKGLSIISPTAASSLTYKFSGRSSTATFNIGPTASNVKKKIKVAITGRAKLEKI